MTKHERDGPACHAPPRHGPRMRRILETVNELFVLSLFWAFLTVDLDDLLWGDHRVRNVRGEIGRSWSRRPGQPDGEILRLPFWWLAAAARP